MKMTSFRDAATCSVVEVDTFTASVVILCTSELHTVIGRRTPIQNNPDKQ